MSPVFRLLSFKKVKTFHYYAPAPEEQRGFAMQFLGTLLGLALCAFLFWRSSDGGFRAMMVGVALALCWMQARAAWALEKKARRAQNAEIGVDEEGLHLTDDAGKSRLVRWDEVQELGVKGGRLQVKWPGGTLVVGAREVQDGMTMVRLVMNHGKDDEPRQRTSFIPLDPR